MAGLPGSNDLVLVAILPLHRDLEIARLLGWYRIPLRSAPKVIQVDYLAFYQTAAFGEHKWRIASVAPMLGYELTTRAALLRTESDHPRSQEEYFKVQIGPLVPLPRPILAGRWKRVTFLYTTGEYLLRARQLRDLVVREDERLLLWRALRERAANAPYATVLPEQDPVMAPDALSILLGFEGNKLPGGWGDSVNS